MILDPVGLTMAHTRLQIRFDTVKHSVFQICKEAGVKGKGANEVFHSWDALRCWKDRFEGRFGFLSECIHHSNPDDPPDLTFVFENGQIEVEHTRLEPSHIGWANALHRRVCPDKCITVPSISYRPKNQRDLLSTMLSPGSSWTNEDAEMSEWFLFLENLILKKFKDRAGGVLVIQNGLTFLEAEIRFLAEAIHARLSSIHGLIQDWTVLLHTQRNSIQFISCLITGAEDLQVRSQIDA